MEMSEDRIVKAIEDIVFILDKIWKEIRTRPMREGIDLAITVNEYYEIADKLDRLKDEFLEKKEVE